MAKLEKLPSTLSFQRCLLVTDGLFFNEYANGETEKLMVMRHGIRATQNVSEKNRKDDATKNPVANIQIIDSAKLDANAKCLQVRFQLRSISLEYALFSYAREKNVADGETFPDRLWQFLKKAREGQAVDILARRYVRNITNGRFLWRNRMVASAITVDVYLPNGNVLHFDGLKEPLDSFANISAQEEEIATVLANGFRGKDKPSKALRVVAHVETGMGGALEVFPSQNYIDNKPMGYGRLLYCLGGAPESGGDAQITVMGQAALRDQKVGNALRTIDTWYPSYGETRRPLAVEPNGACLSDHVFYREGDASAFNLLTAIDEIDPASDDGLFLLACIIRGGVYAESDKAPAKTKKS